MTNADRTEVRCDPLDEVDRELRRGPLIIERLESAVEHSRPEPCATLALEHRGELRSELEKVEMVPMELAARSGAQRLIEQCSSCFAVSECCDRVAAAQQGAIEDEGSE
jgi:hypothetical protein